MVRMKPWYRGFKGTVDENAAKTAFETVGIVEKKGEDVIEISELPIKRWTQVWLHSPLEEIRPHSPSSGKSGSGRVSLKLLLPGFYFLDPLQNRQRWDGTAWYWVVRAFPCRTTRSG